MKENLKNWAKQQEAELAEDRALVEQPIVSGFDSIGKPAFIGGE